MRIWEQKENWHFIVQSAAEALNPRYSGRTPRLGTGGKSLIFVPCSCTSVEKLLQLRWFLTPIVVKEKNYSDAFLNGKEGLPFKPS